ncbi:uncharacterized protein LOC126293415 [Schistocerca gregaria]|uniref:uncharacterized protein LOC126293415 n=1 Tax=Schistocerca gregaria TaxID=7010 RepID=UPI00211DCD42|nr:uncharacterized protein LOC126293415 [Schistocerca gregaria]
MLMTYFRNRYSHRGLIAFCAAAVVGFAGGLLFTGESCQLDGENLSEKVRVLCVVITQPENHRDKADAVKETWGQRCSQLLFFSSQLDMMLPVVTLNVSEGREVLWNKTKAAVRYAWDKGLLRRNEWLLKADDDTYVVMENLRQLLQPLEPEEALYLGLHLLANVPEGYMSGGAGYVLSRGAVQRLVAAWDLDVELKEDDSGFEDINIGAENVRTTNEGDTDARHSAGSTWNPDFRFQASLWWHQDEFPLCGAVVIDERNLVTAGHCIYDGIMRPTRRPINFLRITVGSPDYQKATSYDVGYTYTHFYFDTLGLDHDISVVRLKKPMKLGKNVRTIPLAASAPAPGTVCQLSGWGSWANRGDNNSTILRHMDVVVQTQDKCLGPKDTDVTTPLICVAPKNGDVYTHADDGGPLTCSGELVGVVIRNGRNGLGVAITDVSLYTDFVAESVAHPGRGAWPFVSSLLTGMAEAGTCLAITALLARMSSAR